MRADAPGAEGPAWGRKAREALPGAGGRGGGAACLLGGGGVRLCLWRGWGEALPAGAGRGVDAQPPTGLTQALLSTALRLLMAVRCAHDWSAVRTTERADPR